LSSNLILEVSCQCDIGAGHGERIARRRADHGPVPGPRPSPESPPAKRARHLGEVVGLDRLSAIVAADRGRDGSGGDGRDGSGGDGTVR
jgi:hypothetical protein